MHISHLPKKYSGVVSDKLREIIDQINDNTKNIKEVDGKRIADRRWIDTNREAINWQGGRLTELDGITRADEQSEEAIEAGHWECVEGCGVIDSARVDQTSSGKEGWYRTDKKDLRGHDIWHKVEWKYTEASRHRGGVTHV